MRREGVEDLVGGLVQMNGFGVGVPVVDQRRTSASSAVAQRRSLRLVSSANQRSTRFSQELLVG